MYVCVERFRHTHERSSVPVPFQYKRDALELACAVMAAHPEVRVDIEFSASGAVEEDRCSWCGEVHAWTHAV